MKKTIFILAVALMGGIAVSAQNLSGRDIAQKVKDRPDGNTRYAELELTLKKKNGSTRQRKVTSWAMDEGKDTKKMMFFTYPGDVKGTGFLTWDYDQIGKEDAKWLYLPAMKKTRRISGSSSKTDYFMGTDFTYDDMGSRHVDEDKQVSWIRQDCLVAAHVECYDKLNKLHRVLTVSDVKKIQGFWTIQKMEMKNVQTEHSTLIVVKNSQYDVKIDKSLFTVAKLEKGL